MKTYNELAIVVQPVYAATEAMCPYREAMESIFNEHFEFSRTMQQILHNPAIDSLIEIQKEIAEAIHPVYAMSELIAKLSPSISVSQRDIIEQIQPLFRSKEIEVVAKYQRKLMENIQSIFCSPAMQAYSQLYQNIWRHFLMLLKLLTLLYILSWFIFL